MDVVMEDNDDMISNVKIDDPELFTTKKHLLAKFTPLTIIKSL